MERKILFLRKILFWEAYYLTQLGTIDNLSLLYVLFKLPVWLRDKFDKFMKKFLWYGSRLDKQPYHLVDWHRVCKSKREGSMGVITSYIHMTPPYWLSGGEELLNYNAISSSPVLVSLNLPADQRLIKTHWFLACLLERYKIALHSIGNAHTCIRRDQMIKMIRETTPASGVVE